MGHDVNAATDYDNHDGDDFKFFFSDFSVSDCKMFSSIKIISSKQTIKELKRKMKENIINVS